MHIKLISPAGVMYQKGKGIFPQVLRYAPLTLSTLAGLLNDRGHRIELIDEGVQTDSYNDFPDLVGISAITGTANRAYAIADHYRLKGVPVIMGGAHPTLMPNEAAEHADSIVLGLAFDTWPQLIDDFGRGELKRVYHQDSPSNLSNLPTPRRDLLKNFSYISKASIEATYGCPYKCDFCAVTNIHDYGHRPIGDVIKELSLLKGPFVSFVDPSPIENKEYAKELYRAMIPLKKKWGGLATIHIADDDELLDLAVESGCKGLLIGFESVSQEANQEISKGFNNVDHYKQVIKKLHDRKIAINGTFMFGMDSHTKDIFEETVDFVIEQGIDLPRYAIYTPFPGTPSFTRLKKEGRILTENWSLYDVQHTVFKPSQMTPQDLFEGNIWAWEQTYKVGSIIKRLKKSKTQFPFMAFANLGYKYYADRLRHFPNEAMIQFEKQTILDNNLKTNI